MEHIRPGASGTEITDRKWKGLYILSGIILLVTAVLSLVAAYGARTLYSLGYPNDPASYLQLVSQHQQLAAITWCLWIVMDFLGLAPTVAIYLVLARHGRILALLGSLFSIFYCVYDVSVTELNSLTLVSLSHGFANAATDAVRTAIVAAAAYGYYALPLQTVLSFGIGSFGYLLWCIPMAKSFFGRWTAILGIIVNIIGLFGSAAPVVPSSYLLGLCQFLCVRLIAVWVFVVGVQLYRFGHRVPAVLDNPASPS